MTPSFSPITMIHLTLNDPRRPDAVVFRAYLRFRGMILHPDGLITPALTRTIIPTQPSLCAISVSGKSGAARKPTCVVIYGFPAREMGSREAYSSPDSFFILAQTFDKLGLNSPKVL